MTRLIQILLKLLLNEIATEIKIVHAMHQEVTYFFNILAPVGVHNIYNHPRGWGGKNIAKVLSNIHDPNLS